MSLEILIGIDRDGTFIEDKNKSFPGKNYPFMDDINFIPNSIGGLQILRDLPNTKLVVISNQAGPARGVIPEEHIPKINKYIDCLLQKVDVNLDGFYFCPHVTQKYALEKRKEGKIVLDAFVKDCPDYKPKTGQLIQAAKTLYKKPLEQLIVYTIGDRALDVQTGLNADGKGVFVSNNNEHQMLEMAKVEDLKVNYGLNRVLSSHDLRDAAMKIKYDIKHRF